MRTLRCAGFSSRAGSVITMNEAFPGNGTRFTFVVGIQYIGMPRVRHPLSERLSDQTHDGAPALFLRARARLLQVMNHQAVRAGRAVALTGENSFTAGLRISGEQSARANQREVAARQRTR